jgi:hypothetical protein
LTFAPSSRDNSSGYSVSQSHQLDHAVPAGKIANLSTGEFVGIVSDTSDQRMTLKGFHCEVLVDHKAVERRIPLQAPPGSSHGNQGADTIQL